MQKLEAKRKNGRDDYSVRVMWNLLIAMIVFGHKTVESFRRELSRNSQLRRKCGLYDYAGKKHLVPPSRVFRETHINVRTTTEEKVRFERNARKCGMSLSAYLRALANGHEPKALPPIQYGELVKVLSDSYNLFHWRKRDDAADRIMYLVKRLTEEISPERISGKNGDNENMAGS